MIAILQRVTKASVTVDEKILGAISDGLLVFASIEVGDTIADARWLAEKIVTLRIFRNGEKYFDADVRTIHGSILLISNFTIAAATRRGRRPSFDPAMPPAQAEPIFNSLLAAVAAQNLKVETGKFGADMRVSLTNDGPATFIVRTDPKT